MNSQASAATARLSLRATTRPGLRRDLMVASAALLALTLIANVVGEFTVFEWTLWVSQAILAMSLTVVWGLGGIFSFGQAALYGIGGYIYGIVAINLAGTTGETLTAIGAGIAVAIVSAAFLGYFMFYGNVGDIYVAIITLATSLVFFAMVNSTSGSSYRIGEAAIGGYNGMTGIPRLVVPVVGELTRVQSFAALAGVMLFVAVVLRALQRTPFGRITSAVADNADRAEMIGYDIRRQRLLVFMVGGAIAGLGGGIFATWGRFMSPTIFSLSAAAVVVIWVLVGGRDSVIGAILGVVVVQAISSVLGGANGQYKPIVLGAMLIFVVLVAPKGIVGFFRSRLKKVGEAPLGVERAADSVRAVGALPAFVVKEQQSLSLQTLNLSKSYGGVQAVKGVDLNLTGRGVHCLIGPNGAGKSTFFDLLTGRVTPDTGQVVGNGHDIHTWRTYRRARHGIGIKTQVPSTFEGLSVQENLWLASYSACHNAESATERARMLVDWLGLQAVSGAEARGLSHGDQQWLEITMVIAAQPSIILLDEPSAGMTTAETVEIASLVRFLGERAVVVVVEHDMDFIRALDAPITVLDRGRILATGNYADLSSDERVKDAYLGHR